MAMIEINWNPGRRELRQFAGLWLAVFGALGGWKLYASAAAAGWPWLGAAVAVGLPGLVWPALVRPLYVAWMALAFPIGWTVSHLLLALIYYGVVTPIGLVLRLRGVDPMNRRFEPEATTYWVEHRTGDDKSRYFRQF
ncbi:MAG: hypothetical protein D6815_11195 [Candidatus Dadabacteria bacterium]|nr:MAG: hypothetical protein D6815_11195 [Candidatus Dadabacteria bacterium]